MRFPPPTASPVSDPRSKSRIQISSRSLVKATRVPSGDSRGHPRVFDQLRHLPVPSDPSERAFGGPISRHVDQRAVVRNVKGRLTIDIRQHAPVVSRPGSPPAAATRKSPTVVLSAKMIVSSSLQVARVSGAPSAQRVSDGPPRIDTFFSVRSPSALSNPTQVPSGEKNGWRAPSVPSSGVPASRSRART